MRAMIAIAIASTFLLVAIAHFFRYETILPNTGGFIFFDRWTHRVCRPNGAGPLICEANPFDRFDPK
ncbi:MULTISPECIES: hypothetical protein [unclassified Cupriavidus]|uniref:hypothetical protein n=1 Tax=unclassified Cupriavidus TaxID=2640874 RepID=UPI00313C6BAD